MTIPGECDKGANDPSPKSPAGGAPMPIASVTRVRTATARSRAQAPARLLWGVLLTAAMTAPATERLTVPGISGDDARERVDARERPWQAIGRVSSTLGPFCTGTLIGPRRVLTAAHCLWNRRTASWLPACALHFLAGYQRGGYVAHARIIDYTLAGRHRSQAKGPPTDPTRDWAVLLLDQDLSRAATPLTTAPLDRARLQTYRAEGGELVQAGYSRDRPHVLTVNQPCQLAGFARAGNVALHACDATFGDSGSPILSRQGDDFHVVAVLVGIENAGGRGIAVTGATFHEGIEALATQAVPEGAAPGC